MDRGPPSSWPLKASFIPSRPERELRDLVRYRRSLIEQRAHEVQRVHKLLEAANIKLEDVISDVMGVNGRRFLAALLEPDYDPEALARRPATACSASGTS